MFVGDLTGKAVYPYNDAHSISGDELSFILPASYDLGSALTNTNAAGRDTDADQVGIYITQRQEAVMQSCPDGVHDMTVIFDSLNKKEEGDLIKSPSSFFIMPAATCASLHCRSVRTGEG